MHDDVLNEFQLAEFLKVRAEVVARLLVETGLPRFFIAGEARFIRPRILTWLEGHEARDLLPPIVAVGSDAADEVVVALAPIEIAVSRLSTASPGEVSWLSAEAMDALVSGAGDPGRNLDRLKVRDALLELNDAVLPVLTRLSTGRLHPHHDEKSRTSPWRLDLDADGRIDAIGIAWGAGEHAPARFADRPHLAVELTGEALRVRLDTHGKRLEPPVSFEETQSLAAAGFRIEPAEPEGEPQAITKTYMTASPMPSTSQVARTLEADFERLVPLWARVG
jgi:hypothetical protein